MQVTLYESEFLKMEGDPSWLKGHDFVPAKLNKLQNINKLLAHQPWMLTSHDMKVCAFVLVIGRLKVLLHVGNATYNMLTPFLY